MDFRYAGDSTGTWYNTQKIAKLGARAGNAWSETSREVDVGPGWCGTCVVRMRTTGRKTLVNARSRRTVVRYDMNGNRDGSMAGSTRGWA